MKELLVLLSVLALQIVDAARPGEELGPPVTEESQPNEGDDLVEEPVPPPGKDWGEDAGPTHPGPVDASPRAAAPRRRDIDATPAPATAAAPAPAAASEGAGILIIVLLGLVAVGLAAVVLSLRARGR